MTATKTKRDRAAGRRHRQTAIQTIIDNHEGIIDDIARIDIAAAELHNTTCYLNTRLIVWHDRLEEQNDYTRQNVAHAMQRVARNERKQAEVECAVAFLQHTSKEHMEAIAQLTAYVNKVNGRADALQQKTDLLRDELNETNKRLIQLAWVNTIIWLSAALTIFALLIVP
jgi:hypothetical protein|nr:MAG TPA: hypothetical protein [Caudoviricetes sp.]